MAAKALDLFQAYSQGKLPFEGGYIVSSFFDKNSTYSRYETVAFNGVKNIHLSGGGLSFQTDGNKSFVLVEPPTYSRKYIEPVNREMGDQIPHRFNELDIYTCKNQQKVMVSKDPIMTYSSFTILKPTGLDFSLIFFNLPEVIETLRFFYTETLVREAKVPKSDARKATDLIIKSIENFSIW